MQNNTYKRTLFTKCLLIFLRQKAKIQFSGKIDSEKNKKIFIVYNDNKIVRTWYLSSNVKWPVCRSIVNQTTRGTRRTKLIAFFDTNTFKYCALFCSKVGILACSKGILSIQIMGKWIFSFFWPFSILNGEQN